jgi:hypothetical protein
MLRISAKDFTSSIGCVGCLIYLILFGTTSIILAYFRVNTLWAFGVMVLYVSLWGGAMLWNAYKKK